MGRRKVLHLPRLCPICGQEFTPTDSRRDICYKQACIDARSQEYNLKKSERRRKLKAAGTWKEHIKSVRGTGKGRKGMPHAKTRKCLGWCGNTFPVPPGTDKHFCLECECKRQALIEDFDESALGLATNEPGDIIKHDKEWYRGRGLY